MERRPATRTIQSLHTGEIRIDPMNVADNVIDEVQATLVRRIDDGFVSIFIWNSGLSFDLDEALSWTTCETPIMVATG